MHGVWTEIEGQQVLLCAVCWNKYISKYRGTDFETIELKPVTLRDCTGKTHEFHFFTHLVPSGLAIEAREMTGKGNIGYAFSVLGADGCDQPDLILDLYKKMKRGLSKKYLKIYRTQKTIQDSRVAGRIEWDDDFHGELPRLVIDGQQVTWTEFGKMLMSFEGWQFKLDIIDPAFCTF